MPSAYPSLGFWRSRTILSRWRHGPCRRLSWRCRTARRHPLFQGKASPSTPICPQASRLRLSYQSELIPVYFVFIKIWVLLVLILETCPGLVYCLLEFGRVACYLPYLIRLHYDYLKPLSYHPSKWGLRGLASASGDSTSGRRGSASTSTCMASSGFSSVWRAGGAVGASY